MPATPAGTADVATSGVTITLYNGQHQSLTNALVKDFEARSGITVKVRSGESDMLANQIVAEGKRSPADVIYTEDSPPLTLLAEKGLLAKVDANTLSKVAPQWSGKNGDWVGVSARARVVVYNPSLISEKDLPHSIMDLSQPSWKGKVAIAPTSGAFQAQITAVRKLEGETAAKQWLKGLARNAKRYNSNAAVLEAVGRGEVALGLINHYYWYIKAAEVGADNMHSQLYYFGHGDPGALINVSGAAVLASSRHPQAAQQFLAYLVSEEGQETLAHASFEYPLGSGVKTSKPLKPFATLEPPDIIPQDLGDNQKTLQLMREVGLI
jgi:iron(III) transport system substrate-binding protein